MKRFFLSLIFTFLVFCFGSLQGFCAQESIKTIAVITDTGHRHGTNYLICGAASDIIATDIINKINMTGRMKAPLLGETMAGITQKNIPLFYMTFFNEYKYNYNVDFINLKRITKNIPADYLLLITSGLDVQSNFLKDTWWNKLNIPGMDPVKPTYKLSTLITLIDKTTYKILWQDLYLKDIEANNYDLGIVQFSPSYAQLSKIKKYSKNMSEYVTNIVDKQVNPWIVPTKKPSAFGMKSKFVNEGTKMYYPTVNGEVVKQNFNEFKNDTNQKFENIRQKREEKKNIENIRKLEEQKNNLKQQKEENTKTIELKKKNDEKLFETIKDNIDDVSNSLPPIQTEAEDKIIPAINVEPKVQDKKDELKEVEIVKPVITTPVIDNKTENKIEEKTNQPIKEPIKEPTNDNSIELKKQRYDWNLKNIYLEKIGSTV